MTGFATRIDHPSQTSEARSRARALASQAGFDEVAAERVSIVVTEAGTNLVKHAGGGQILIRTAECNRRVEIELLALDNGPGIREADSRDGYSTTGTMGTGLGAIARLSRLSEVYSRPGRGAALLARIAPSDRDFDPDEGLGVVQTAKPGETVCGDHWGTHVSASFKTLLVADGLGHGPEAAKAAHAAVDILSQHPDMEPQELLERAHQALRATRGAAVAAAKLDLERRLVSFAGLGNICGSIWPDGETGRHMVSVNGTAGIEARHIREFTYPYPEGSTLILHTDGIKTHWSLRDYPGIATRHPGLIAGVIYRDHCRGNDDATIVACK